MKRKTVLATSVAAIAAVTLLGGTLAWFTQEGEKTNFLATDQLNVQLKEPNYEDTLEEGKDTFEGVTPGDVVVKDPTFYLAENSINARVQYRVVVSFKPNDGNTFEEGENTLDKIVKFGNGEGENFDELKVDGKSVALKNKLGDDKYATDWTGLDVNNNRTFDDGDILTEGKEVPAFSNVKFEGAAMTNYYQQGKFTITVEYRAIQAEHTHAVDMDDENLVYEKEPAPDATNVDTQTGTDADATGAADGQN
ncbi:hypothetical protein SAMN02910358_00612 [Lachnospiraceae bacterium XBB1006]|nr:hypothetical protein SAMN02910358_00612 [Lachnospiraceae bacterium XBB1006]